MAVQLRAEVALASYSARARGQCADATSHDNYFEIPLEKCVGSMCPVARHGTQPPGRDRDHSRGSNGIICRRVGEEM